MPILKFQANSGKRLSPLQTDDWTLLSLVWFASLFVPDGTFCTIFDS